MEKRSEIKAWMPPPQTGSGSGAEGPLEDLAGPITRDASQHSEVRAAVAEKCGEGRRHSLGTQAHVGWLGVGGVYPGSGELQVKSTGCANKGGGCVG